MYIAEITESSFEMSNRQKVMYKDISECISVNYILKKGDRIVLTHIGGWYTLHVKNDSARNPEYDIFVILTREHSYQTGSKYVKESFLELVKDLGDDIYAEDIEIEIKKFGSRNNENGFYKCVLH